MGALLFKCTDDPFDHTVLNQTRFNSLDALTLLGRNARPCTAIDLCAFDPVEQRVGVHSTVNDIEPYFAPLPRGTTNIVIRRRMSDSLYRE